MICPVPPHWLHGRETEKNPCVNRSSPVPPQVGQLRAEPLLEPDPLQTSQRLGFGIRTFTSLPKAASSNEISRLYRRSPPRAPPVRLPPAPPKISPKMSPKMSLTEPENPKPSNGLWECPNWS